MAAPKVVWTPNEGSQRDFLTCPADEILLHGNRGGGKAQPLDSLVLCPSGFRKIGDLVVGDVVMSPNRSISTVIGVYPQGKKKVWEVIFTDGSTVECCAEHLWSDRYGTTCTTEQLHKGFTTPCSYKHREHVVREVLGCDEEEVEMVCIKVSSRDGLYITDGFVVTHNTDVLLMDFAQDVNKGYGVDLKGIIFRKSYPELEDLISKSKKWFSSIFPTAKYHSTSHTWTFDGGETLMLRFAEKENDYYSYHGREITHLSFEELTNWPTQTLYLMLHSIVRTSNPNIRKKIRATCNPSGPGHCVPYGDVLTPSGWVPIADIKIGQAVFTVDKNLIMQVAPVEQIHAGEFRGKLIRFAGPDAYIIGTESHKLPYTNIDGNKIVGESMLCKFKKNYLPIRQMRWVSTDPSPRTFLFDELATPETIKQQKYGAPRRYKYHDYLTILGFYLKYGYVGLYNRVNFYTLPDELKEVLDRLEIPVFKHDNQTFYFYSKYWYQLIVLFGKDNEKFIDPLIKNFDTKELRVLFNVLLDDNLESSKMYYKPATFRHPSQQLVSDMSELALKLGYRIQHNIEKTVHGITWGSFTISIDERTTFSTETKEEIEYEGMVYCIGIRNTHNFILRQRGHVFVSGNSWVKARFIDATPEGVPLLVTDKETGITKSLVHIKSTLDENKPFLKADPSYKATLRDLAAGNAILEKAWIEGSWDIISGGILSDVWDHKVHMIEPFLLPKGSIVSRGFDWGSAKPWAVLYFYESNGEELNKKYYPKGSIFIIKEIYGWNGTPNQGDNATTSEIAAKVVATDTALMVEHGCRIKPGPADTMIWEVRDGVTLARNMEMYGCYWTRAYKGSGSRITGISQIRQMLLAAKTNHREVPHLYFFSSCVHCQRTLPLLPRDPHNPEDVDTTCEDHAIDVCFSGDTTVRTIDGIKTLKELEGTEGYVLTDNGEYAPYTNCKQHHSSSDVVRLTFSNGDTIVCTPDHKFLTSDGFIPANELTLYKKYCRISVSRYRTISICKWRSLWKFLKSLALKGKHFVE